MKATSVKIFGVLCLFLFSTISYAEPHYGATFSYALIAKEPTDLHGFQFMLNYDPDCFKWRRFNIYFDGGYSHFWLNHGPHSTISIYSIAPVIRHQFKKRGPFNLYLDLSIGVAYLNQTRIDNRNLGIHFAFQDRAGLAFTLDCLPHLIAGIHAVHYSNAHLSSHNSGMTLPLIIDIGYRF